MAWHALAAEQGDAGAQFTVGACYCNGRHGAVQADKVAREWWVKAGVQGDENARKGLRILDAATAKAAQALERMFVVSSTTDMIDVVARDSLTNIYTHTHMNCGSHGYM